MNTSRYIQIAFPKTNQPIKTKPKTKQNQNRNQNQQQKNSNQEKKQPPKQQKGDNLNFVVFIGLVQFLGSQDPRTPNCKGYIFKE